MVNTSWTSDQHENFPMQQKSKLKRGSRDGVIGWEDGLFISSK